MIHQHVTTTKPLLKRAIDGKPSLYLSRSFVALKELWFMKEQIKKYARKRIKVGCYLKVTLDHRGLIYA
jgi:hypothetical protein